MKNDFITIFKTIEPIEQEAFSQYIKHFYTPQKAVLNIFAQATQAIATKEEEQYLLSVANHKNTLNGLSDLKKWLLEFLTIQEVKNNSYEAQFLTLEALRKRKLHAYFKQKSKQLSEELAEHPSPNLWVMFSKLRLAHINYFDVPIDRFQDYKSQIQELFKALHHFQVSAKLKYSAELYSRSYILQETYDTQFLEEIIQFASQSNSANAAIKNLYLPLLTLTKERSLEAYQTLKSFIIDNQQHESIEKLSVLLYLLNYAINRIRQNDKSFYDEYFELAKIGQAQSLFVAAGYFPTNTFSNIVNLGCHLKQYEWTQEFIEKNAIDLEKQDRITAKNMALARVYFEQKQFGKAIQSLHEIPIYKNIAYNIHARTLLIRAYYEQNETPEALLSACAALKIYVQRSQNMGADLKTSAYNFIKILRQLVKGKPKHQIVKELNTFQEPILCLDWLKEKSMSSKK